MPEQFDDARARALRALWFGYLDLAAAHRPDLHRYARALTGSVFAAEDIVQETLLRGFAAAARGDLHGENSRVRDLRAYLFRTASNLWIDLCRRAQHEADAIEAQAAVDTSAAVEAHVATAEAAGQLFAAASPQERAVIVLAEAFGFSHAEIAELLDTTVGAVKAALHRGRGKLLRMRSMPRATPVPAEVLARFVAAFDARDAAALTALLLDTVAIEVPAVGGGRGRDGEWVRATVAYASGRAVVREFEGEPVLLECVEHDGVVRLEDVLRVEGDAAGIARIRDYCYCPETLQAVADALGYAFAGAPYRQPDSVLANMIATTQVPWRAIC